MQDSSVCQHEACQCQTSDASGYCSPYCANVEQGDTMPGYGDVPGACACGHQGCHPALMRQEPQSKISVGKGGG